MPPRKPLVRFLFGVALVYALGIAPWPGLGDAYRSWFRGLGNSVFASPTGLRHVAFEDLPRTERRSLDTRIVLANRSQRAPGGTPVRLLDLDLRGVAWVPVVLTVALILASPLSWGRRLRALGLGLIAIHAFVLFSLWIHLLDNSDAAAGPALVALSPFWTTIVSGLSELLITQFGVGFFMPVAIWAAVAFRCADFAALAPPPISPS